ncbi:NUDIX domain-containing protein [Larsenimonas rhizosphaerae]|uniref:ADP-ribose pyrophosphatase n=1 Tax=Larsenimonas rhizosphaerae TaxID=2944682 RepID=A0AA42CY53_9GAMM|nr:NUDIX domain-containing protein [Larsenimonas rhizosphaerae]MCX2524723.1 NUDIX domain-containing protein [Larsenimonas rhizosphaerae]
MSETVPDTPRFTGADVETVETEVLQDGFFSLECRHFKHRRFDGSTSPVLTREVHVRHDAVGIILYDPARDAVVLVEQCRAGALNDPVTPWLIEPVAGLVDKDESLEDVARREAEEEAGCSVSEVIRLYSYYPSPGACTERVTLFCALIDSAPIGGVHGLADEGEDIQVHVIAFPAAWEMMMAGRLNNAMAIIGMQWLSRERASLRARS